MTRAEDDAAFNSIWSIRRSAPSFSPYETGVPLQNIRTAVDHLRNRGVTELERITLMSDGASIYECASPDEIIDLLAGGQGVFGIAVGKVWNEVEGSLATLQGEVNGEVIGGENNDELSLRRKAKGA